MYTYNGVATLTTISELCYHYVMQIHVPIIDHRVYSYICKCLYIDKVHLQVSGYVFYIIIRTCMHII